MTAVARALVAAVGARALGLALLPGSAPAQSQVEGELNRAKTALQGNVEAQAVLGFSSASTKHPITI